MTKTCHPDQARVQALARFCSLFLLLAILPNAWAQQKVVRIDIKHVGPPAVSDELIRSNIRVKPGDPYIRSAIDDDVRNLYATGFFYNIRVAEENAANGVVLTYIVQGKPRLTEIKFHGNSKFSDAKLRKKISSKAGEPLDERKLFTDCQEIQKMYQKSGYPKTEVKYVLNIEENVGRGTATFEITEGTKEKIIEVDFVGATAFPQKQLRKVIKTRKHWMFSWLTGSGHLKDDVFEEDQERLRDFYHDHGYIDFDIKEIRFVNPTPQTMIIRFSVFEGRQYKVGSLKFTGNKLFPLPQLTNGLRFVQAVKGGKVRFGPNGLPMDVGDIFTPKGLTRDIETVEDFYGSRGYIDVTSPRNLNVIRFPNTETGTMDLEFKIEEGQKSYIEKIEIRGNTKTKDRVIRRELAVAPGEVFDMTRVKLSKDRLEGLQYFERVDARPEPGDGPYLKNLVVGVDEKNTGNLTMGAGFSSVDALVGFAEVSQGNFDLFHPPTFTGGGQKFRLRVQLGTQRMDYLLSFIEPWFLGRKLQLGVDLFYRKLDFESVNNIYDEVQAGGRVSLTRALYGDNLIGTVSYTLESIGILLNPGYHGPEYVPVTNPAGPPGGVGLPTGPGGPPPGGNAVTIPANVPNAILEQVGYSLLSRVGTSLAYDTRNSVLLPNKGQRTEVFTEFVGGPLGGNQEFYRIDLKTFWYFKGLAPGHVLELAGHLGVVDSLQNGADVPFYERYYLGGLYSLRGYKYRSVSPRQAGAPTSGPLSEPIGGDTVWFGTAEYSIPIMDRLRIALFYDVGNVVSQPWYFTTKGFPNASGLTDNWGIGLRLNLPIGPLRLDYGIPITHDQYNGSSGQFQFGVGYTREF